MKYVRIAKIKYNKWFTLDNSFKKEPIHEVDRVLFNNVGKYLPPLQMKQMDRWQMYCDRHKMYRPNTGLYIIYRLSLFWTVARLTIFLYRVVFKWCDENAPSSGLTSELIIFTNRRNKNTEK